MSDLKSNIKRNVIIQSWNFLSRSEYLDYYKYSKKFHYFRKDKIHNIQILLLKKLFQEAKSNTIYYQDIFDKIKFDPENFNSFDQIKSIPILSKSIIKEKKEQLISKQFSISKLVKGATGGSTGVPLTFYSTSYREVKHAATTAMNYEWAGVKLSDKISMLWGAPFDITKSQQISEKVKNFIFGRQFLPTFELSDNILDIYVQKINEFKPNSLLGYTSSLIAFAEHIDKVNTKLINLKSVISGAETLFDHQRRYLEKIFKCPVFNRYGGRDSGAVAFECPEEHSMHINENVVYTEIVNGKVVITDLYNYGMPFIRYDTGDIGEITSKVCSCGRNTRILENIEGKSHDLLKTKDGRLVPGEFFPHLFKDTNSFREFQVIQNDINELDIKVVKDRKNYNSQDEEYILSNINKYFGKIKINFIYVDKIPKLKSGKYKFTISNI